MQKDLGNANVHISPEIDEFEKMMDFMENALTSNIEVFYGGSCAIDKATTNGVALSGTNHSDYTSGVLIKVSKSDTNQVPFSFAVPAGFMRSLINAAMGGDQSNQSTEFDDFDLSTGGEILGQAMNTFGSAVSLEYGKPIAAYNCEAKVFTDLNTLKETSGLSDADTLLQTTFGLNIDGFSTFNCTFYTNIQILKDFVKSVGKTKAPAPAPVAAPAPQQPPVDVMYQEQNTLFRAPLTKTSMELLMNIPLEISIQIGSTSKKIKEICDFTNGTVIELDKPINQPIDVLANDHLIAHGEVVVSGDNFGIKITEVLDMKEILSNFDNLGV